MHEHELSCGLLCDSTVDLLSNSWNTDSDSGRANISHHFSKLPQFKPADVFNFYCTSSMNPNKKISFGSDNSILVNQFKQLISTSCVTLVTAQLSNKSDTDPKWSMCSHLKVVQELEVGGSLGGLVHSAGELHAATSALSPMVARHGIRCPTFFCYLTHEVNFCLGVCSKC